MRFLVILAVLPLLLAGCVPGSPPDSRVSSPSPTPVFASEDEALAAAETAYRAYLAVSDAIGRDGGKKPERLLDVASAGFAAEEIQNWHEFSEAGYQSIGEAAFDNFTLQAYYSPVEAGPDAIRVYLCSDVSGVDVLNEEGASVVRPDRPNRTALEVGFDLNESGVLVIASREVWDGDGVCK